MEIQTRHRKSAEANRPKGRALLALAERREAPVAALLAALMVGMAAWVKSAFGSAATPPEAAPAAMPESDDQGIVTTVLRDAAAPAPVEAAMAMEEAAAPVAEEAEAVQDLGRIGRGPGMLDLSRFFEMEEPTLDLPPQAGGGAGGDAPAVQVSGMGPMGGMTRAGGAAGGGSAGSSGQVAEGGGTGGGSGEGGAGTPAPGAEFAGIGFEALFAQLAEVARPFHAATVRDIGQLAIGDWISAHELQRLRGPDNRPDPEAAFMAREDRTYQLLSNDETREAFLDRHFPSQASDRGEAMAAARLDDTETDGAGSGPQASHATDGLI